MIIVSVFLSLLFIVIGFVVTKNNANRLLSGYNMLTENENNIKAYVSYFKKFHIFLGLSMLILSVLLFYFVDSDWSGIFTGTYPMLAYIYFIWKGKRFSNMKDTQNKSTFIFAMVIMFAVFIAIVLMFIYALKDNQIEIKNQMITISGDYGTKLNITDIKSIELVNELPEISLKINGVVLQTIEKGYFKTTNGEKVKLLINSQNVPIILLTTVDNQKIYYSSKEESNQEIFNQLIEVIKK